MNQRGSMNQRTDEIERILNASKVNYSVRKSRSSLHCMRYSGGMRKI